MLVFTTLSPVVLSPQTIMALYRGRWQVEIAIKRWKSVLDVDALRAKANSPLAEVWLHGKLLYALMLERRMRRQLGDSWGRLDRERVGTWWRVWGMLKDEMAPMVTGALFWKKDAWAACRKVLVERPRRRKLPPLPPEAIDVLYRCEASKQEGMPIAASWHVIQRNPCLSWREWVSHPPLSVACAVVAAPTFASVPLHSVG